MAETLHLLVSLKKKNKTKKKEKKVSFELLVTGPFAPMKKKNLH